MGRMRPHSGRVGLQKQSPSGFASLGDGNRHPQLDSPPAWAELVTSKKNGITPSSESIKYF